MPKQVLSHPDLDEKLARPVGPFSHAIVAHGSRTLYIAGQIGADASGRVVGPGYAAQYEQILRNVQVIVESAGGRMSDVCSLIHYTTSPLTSTDEDYLAMKRLRMEFFPSDYPTSTLVQVAGLLDPDAVIEVDARAVLD